MIDLDKYEEAIVFKQELECGGVIAVGRDDLLHIIDRLRQAEKDAARYRWLRDESAFTHGNAPLAFFTDTNGDQIAFDFDGSSCSVLHDEMLDAAIDEAMRCNK